MASMKPHKYSFRFTRQRKRSKGKVFHRMKDECESSITCSGYEWQSTFYGVLVMDIMGMITRTSFKRLPPSPSAATISKVTWTTCHECSRLWHLKLPNAPPGLGHNGGYNWHCFVVGKWCGHLATVERTAAGHGYVCVHLNYFTAPWEPG